MGTSFPILADSNIEVHLVANLSSRPNPNPFGDLPLLWAESFPINRGGGNLRGAEPLLREIQRNLASVRLETRHAEDLGCRAQSNDAGGLHDFGNATPARCTRPIPQVDPKGPIRPEPRGL